MEQRKEIAGEKGRAYFCAHLARRNVESLEGHGCTKHTVAIKNLLDHVSPSAKLRPTNAYSVTRTCAYLRVPDAGVDEVGVALKITRTCPFMLPSLDSTTQGRTSCSLIWRSLEIRWYGAPSYAVE